MKHQLLAFQTWTFEVRVTEMLSKLNRRRDLGKDGEGFFMA